jgi:hypothetical protein
MHRARIHLSRVTNLARMSPSVDSCFSNYGIFTLKLLSIFYKGKLSSNSCDPHVLPPQRHPLPSVSANKLVCSCPPRHRHWSRSCSRFSRSLRPLSPPPPTPPHATTERNFSIPNFLVLACPLDPIGTHP